MDIELQKQLTSTIVTLTQGILKTNERLEALELQVRVLEAKETTNHILDSYFLNTNSN